MGTKYTTESVSGYNATPPADDGTVSEANKVKWSTIKTKLPDPLKTAIENIDSKLTTHFNVGPTALTSDTTLDSTHYNKIIQVSGSGVDLTLTDASTLGAGWFCDIVSTDSSNTVALARATAANTIDDRSADTTVLPLESLKIFVNAAANGFITDRRNRSLISTDPGATIGPTHTLYRDSASPAASDLIGGYNLDGEDSAGSRLTYAGIYGEIVDPGSTSADGRLHFRTIIAGTLSDRGYIGSGLVLGTATGGDQGIGTINTSGNIRTDGNASATGTVSATAGLYDNGSRVAWVKISSTSGSSVATVDVNLAAVAGFKDVRVHIRATPATDAQSFTARTSTDGGSTFDSGASDYQYIGEGWSITAAATLDASSSGVNAIPLCGTGTVGNAATEGIETTFTVFNRTDTAKYKLIKAESRWQDSSTNLSSFNLDAQRNSASDIDYVRFFFGAGNVATYEYTLEGRN